jgi:hypothetical protein
MGRREECDECLGSMVWYWWYLAENERKKKEKVVQFRMIVILMKQFLLKNEFDFAFIEYTLYMQSMLGDKIYKLPRRTDRGNCVGMIGGLYEQRTTVEKHQRDLRRRCS